MEENSRFEDLEDEAFPPLPPPHSPGQGGPEDGDPFGNEEENGDVSKLADVPAAKRKGVKRPQPKLDSQRLTSDRGLPALRTLFENVRFKGKGREADDLRLLMQKMENWAHRLYPKLQFDDFIDKVERLGNKKDVQTCLKRIRLDMPLTHDDFMGEEEPAPETNVFEDPDPFNGARFPDDLQGAIHSTPAPSAPPPPSPFTSPPALALTEEQRRRMELNRQRALERKLARQQQQTDSQSVDSASADDPTSVSSADVVSSSEAPENEEETKRLELETDDNTEQQPSESSHRDSEPTEEPAQTQRQEEEEEKEKKETGEEEEEKKEEEEESSPSSENHPVNESEDGEKLMN